MIKVTPVTPLCHRHVPVIYCTEDRWRDTQSHAPLVCLISDVWSTCQSQFTHRKKREGMLRSDGPRAFSNPAAVSICIWAVSSSVWVWERDVRLAVVLPSWLAWQAANVHLRHKRAPCLRNWIHKLKALFRKRKIKQRGTWASVWGREKERGNMRKKTMVTKNRYTEQIDRSIDILRIDR